MSKRFRLTSAGTDGICPNCARCFGVHFYNKGRPPIDAPLLGTCPHCKQKLIIETKLAVSYVVSCYRWPEPKPKVMIADPQAKVRINQLP